MRARTGPARRVAAVCVSMIAALAATGSARAFEPLPQSGQVNDDPNAGIVTSAGVANDDPANSDVVGGALTAGKVAVPWAIFQQQTGGGGHNQVFVRSFAGGAWSTRGNGTVGGRSSAGPSFAGSLNFDQAQDGEVPSIDFAGAGRTVPWATWYEDTSGAGFANNNIFASRFDNSGDASQGRWIFGGQDRGLGGGTVQVPSLNIHTGQDAENPSVAGGSTANPAQPAPWITWQETNPTNGKDQIFVERSLLAQLNCDGITPAGVTVGSDVPAVGGVCWQQTGIPRIGSDPTLNIDPTRDGVEPDIAFTGTQDAVPWVVWYEDGSSGIGLHDNAMVFAAKAVSDVTANGGFHWVAVGSALQATLDTNGTNGYGTCAEAANESGCSLNSSADADAIDPRVAAGTMDAASPTVPWVTWDEIVAGHKQVFVSRLVGTGAAAHFELANGGAPISTGANDSTSPDITFSGHTPYVSWSEDVGGGTTVGFAGHFVGAGNPTFVLDESDVPLTPAATAPVREPISSSCRATPFDADGSGCQGAALGTPFLLFTNGTSPQGLFSDAYEPGAPVTGDPSSITSSSATINASINPRGTPTTVAFQYGTTSAYGQSTTAQTTGPDDASDEFSAPLSGLAAGSTIHYRAVALTDFEELVGADRTVATVAPPPPPSPPSVPAGRPSFGRVKVSGTTAAVHVSCSGTARAKCGLAFKMTVTEAFRSHKLIGVTARKKPKVTHKVLGLGSANLTLTTGRAHTEHVGLNRAGKRLLATRHRISVTFRVTQAISKKTPAKQVLKRKLTFKSKARHKPRRH